MGALKNYWSSLESRERLVLSWGALIVAAILIYVLIWQPWRHALSFMELSVKQMRADSVWMTQQAQAMKNGGVGASEQKYKGAEQSLVSLIQQTAKQAKVDKVIQQIVPNQQNGEVRVVLEGVAFNQWVKWVDQLYKIYGVDIQQINAEKDDEKPNIAEIRVVFARK